MQYIFKVFISISFIISGSSFYTTISNRKIHRAKFELQKVGYDDVDQSEEEMKRKMAWAKHTLMTVAASIMCVPPDVLTTPPMVDPRPPTNSLERLHYGKIRVRLMYFCSLKIRWIYKSIINFCNMDKHS